MTGLPAGDLGRPIRVVLFGGAFLEPGALELLARLDEHPEVEFLGGVCQSPGFGLRHTVADVVGRRRLLAPVVLAAYAGRAAWRSVQDPRAALQLRRRARGALSKMEAVADIHDAAVLERLRARGADLGLVYGSPILKPELFETPAFGTIGIHHGSLPEYRGKKTTFWAMFNGEAVAGVTIQRIGRGIDTGEIVSTAEVPTAGKWYGQVNAELERVGVRLYLAAVLAVKRGQARCRPQAARSSGLYRQPGTQDIVRLWWRQLTAGHGSARPVKRVP